MLLCIVPMWLTVFIQPGSFIELKRNELNIPWTICSGLSSLLRNCYFNRIVITPCWIKCVLWCLLLNWSLTFMMKNKKWLCKTSIISMWKKEFKFKNVSPLHSTKIWSNKRDVLYCLVLGTWNSYKSHANNMQLWTKSMQKIREKRFPCIRLCLKWTVFTRILFGCNLLDHLSQKRL